MAWTGTENFESYTQGNNINGGSGGSGWSTNWSDAGSGTRDIVATPSGGEGSNALRLNSSWARRDISALASGEFSFMMQTTSTSGNDVQGLYLYEGANLRIILRAGVTNGKIEAYNGDTTNYEEVSTLSANTWYTIKIKFGHNANKFAVSINGGAYGADKGTNGAFTSIDSYRQFGTATNNTGYYDDIKNAATTGGTVSPSGSLGLLGVGC